MQYEHFHVAPHLIHMNFSVQTAPHYLLEHPVPLPDSYSFTPALTAGLANYSLVRTIQGIRMWNEHS